MTLSIIVAVADGNVIGKDNSLIWHISEDLKRFKRLTENHTVVMGRKTYMSLPFRPLKNRRNIVITRSNEAIAGVETADSVEQALELCRGEDEVFIIGGASIYEQTIDIVDKIYLTRVLKEFEGDTFFPEISAAKWQSVERSEVFKDDKEEVDFYYDTLIRIKNDLK
ncbi:diacylglycerol kinase [Porphyromonadaceae bacterium COT-184 OH4590]|nr:diacylglycerol kinase [Porphyromonadaceae bacterium COT-184 OH4590]